MNKAKYFLINGENVIGIVYEDEKYGRTLMIRENLDPNFSLRISDIFGNFVGDIDLMNFISSMVPQ